MTEEKRKYMAKFGYDVKRVQPLILERVDCGDPDATIVVHILKATQWGFRYTIKVFTAAMIELNFRIIDSSVDANVLEPGWNNG